MLIDIIAVIIVLISTFIAFMRGFIREVLTIAGVLGALFAAYTFGPALNPVMLGWLGVDVAAVDAGTAEMPKMFDKVPYDIVSPILSYGLIFIVVLVILSIMSHYIAEMARSIGLGPVDRTLGVMFGIGRGVLLLGLLYLPAHLLMTTESDKEKLERWFDGSKSHFYMQVTAEWIAQFLPDMSEVNVSQETKDATEAVKNGNDARKTLERMDLLHKGEKAPAGSSTRPQEGQGYNENFRNELDQLFEQQVDPDNSNGQ